MPSRLITLVCAVGAWFKMKPEHQRCMNIKTVTKQSSGCSFWYRTTQHPQERLISTIYSYLLFYADYMGLWKFLCLSHYLTYANLIILDLIFQFATRNFVWLWRFFELCNFDLIVFSGRVFIPKSRRSRKPFFIENCDVVEPIWSSFIYSPNMQVIGLATLHCIIMGSSPKPITSYSIERIQYNSSLHDKSGWYLIYSE